jgi:hypothetical protein
VRRGFVRGATLAWRLALGFAARAPRVHTLRWVPRQTQILRVRVWSIFGKPNEVGVACYVQVWSSSLSTVV